MNSGVHPDWPPHGLPNFLQKTSSNVENADLDVDDLPAAWVRLYGTNVRVAGYLISGIFYYSVYVPAMNLQGGAWLVFLVLATGEDDLDVWVLRSPASV